MRKLLAVLLALSLLLSGTVVADDALESEGHQSVEQTVVNPETETALPVAEQNKSEQDVNADTTANADDPAPETGADATANADNPTSETGADATANANEPTPETGADATANADEPTPETGVDATANADEPTPETGAETGAETTENANEPTPETGVEEYADQPMVFALREGETCAHLNLDTWTAYSEGTYQSSGAEGHIVSGYPYQCYSCMDCGQEWSDEPSSEKVEYLKQHIFEDGICEECGYVNACAHENMDSATEYGSATYQPNGAEGHIVSGYPYQVQYCMDCGEVWNGNLSSEKVEAQESHCYEDGICVECGYVNTCKHEQLDTWTEYKNAQYTANGQEGHIFSGYPYECSYCPDCEEYWSGEPTAEKVEALEEHYFEGGVCTDCGFKNTCKHENAVQYSDFSGATYSDITPRSHSVRGYQTHYIYCRLCSETVCLGTDDEMTSAVQEHNFWKGACMDCGYKNTCAHEFTWTETSYEYYTGGNAQGHSVTGYKTIWTYCMDCYEIVKEEEEKQISSTTEPHEFENGVCMLCGYKNVCDHAKKTSWSDYDVIEYSGGDADGHNATGYKETGYHCITCGEVWRESRAEKPETVRRPHNYLDGKCTDCGYKNTCTHKNTRIEEKAYFVGDTKIVPVDAKTHSWTGPKIRETVCEDCGEALSRKIIAQNVQFTEEHWFEDLDFCTECGYMKTEPIATPVPTATVTPAPTATMPVVTDEPVVTATPAPVYEEVAAEEVVHGVKTGDATPMVETMMVVAEALEAQSETTTIEIVNIDKVILPEEKEALEALPVREQLLTFLSVIGFEAQVNAAMEASESTFSPEAEALKEQIQSRIAAMDEASYAQFEATLLESFPQETIEIDGVEYSFFVLELEVRVGDEVRYERYGFRREGEEWIFTRLELGE